MAGVYVIAHKLDDGWAGPCKIGISSSCSCRLNSLQSGNPKPIGLYVFYNIGDRHCASQTEKALHRMLSGKRLVGEWFNVDPDYAAYLSFFLITKTVNEGAIAHGIDMDACAFVADLASGPGASFGDDS